MGSGCCLGGSGAHGSTSALKSQMIIYESHKAGRVFLPLGQDKGSGSKDTFRAYRADLAAFSPASCGALNSKYLAKN